MYMGQLLDIKTTKVWRFCQLQLVLLPELGSMVVSAPGLLPSGSDSCTHFSGDSGLHSDLNSLMGLKRVVDLQFAQLSLCCEDKNKQQLQSPGHIRLGIRSPPWRVLSEMEV